MTPPIPQRIEAQTFDWAVYTLAILFQPDIQLVTDLDGPADPERLGRALRLLLDAEPVLGCRFVPAPHKPYWARLKDWELDEAELLEVVRDDHPFDDGEVAFRWPLATDGLAGPQVKARLIRGGEADRLVLCVNHWPADAGATKQVAYRLAEIYRELGRDPDYQPAPNLGSRSMRQVFRQVRLRHAPALAARAIRNQYRQLTPFRSLTLRGRTDRGGMACYALRRINAAEVAAIRRYARDRKATINDVFVAATFRAMAQELRWDGRAGLRLQTTVDLRRHLPEGEIPGICNLSAFTFPDLRGELGDGFDDTLSKVKQYMDRVKTFHIGLETHPLSYLASRPFTFNILYNDLTQTFRAMSRSGNLAQTLTNMGPIALDRLDLNGPRATGAFQIVPAGHPPGVALGLSGDGSTLALSAGFRDSAFEPTLLRSLLEAIDAAVPRGDPRR